VLSRGLGVEMDAKARRRKVLEAIAGMDHSPTKKLRAPARLIRETLTGENGSGCQRSFRSRAGAVI